MNSYITKVELFGPRWLITESCASFDELMLRLFKKKSKSSFDYQVIDYLTYLYSRSIYEIITYLHSINYGYQDWKLDNFVITTNSMNEIMIKLCDLDFNQLSDDRYKFSRTHNTKYIYGTNITKDCKVAIKEIHDVICSAVDEYDEERGYDNLQSLPFNNWSCKCETLNSRSSMANTYINKLLSSFSPTDPKWQTVKLSTEKYTSEQISSFNEYLKPIIDNVYIEGKED